MCQSLYTTSYEIVWVYDKVLYIPMHSYSQYLIKLVLLFLRLYLTNIDPSSHDVSLSNIGFRIFVNLLYVGHQRKLRSEGISKY